MHHRKWRIKFFSQGVSYCFTFFIPSSSFKEESMNITTISRLLLYIRDLNFKIFEFKRKFIDSDDIFSGEVLKGSSQEGLREEETYIIIKIPEIQNVLGVPWSIHSWRKLILALRSSVQEARGFIERKPFWSHILGTWLLKREVAINSSYSLMTIRPFRAFLTLTRFYFMTYRSLLYLIIYWTKTVFIDSS